MTTPDCAIRARGVGKQFQLRAARTSFPTFRDALTESARKLLRGFRKRRDGSPRSQDDMFWALRDVSFDVAHGEVMGIIGGNGAGKSTLLKVLSRITDPTEGRIEVEGRVASLLEVGTGFHPELSGRENTFLNGAILGMARRDIARQFDDIVAFAEVERFIDTAVKHYSSGMYLRLAFAVAAHLEPEILVVDEVLAVGDAAFQKKCLGKMEDVARQGRTVLFVSHNMDAIQRLCPRCVLLEHGRIAADGPADVIVSRYLARLSNTAEPNRWMNLTGAVRSGSGDARVTGARYTGDPGLAHRAVTGGPLEVHCQIESDRPRNLSSFAVTIYSQSGAKLVNADTVALGESVPVGAGRSTVGIRIEQLHLNPGQYTVGLWIGDSAGHAVDHIEDAFVLDVVLARGRGFGTAAAGIVACNFHLVTGLTESPGE